MAPRISEEIRAHVRRRAKDLCEYCHTDERWQYVRFTMDHVRAFRSGGGDHPDNLALACFHCNRRKSNKETSVDPATGDLVSIFNPRLNQWADHFIWSKDRLYIIPLTSIGRATVALLDLNRERILAIRSADVVVHRHPPADDPIQQAQ